MNSKLIIVPLEKYNSMMSRINQIDSGMSGIHDLKKEVAATLKNQETTELIQRKNEYKDAHEEIPKSLDKKIKQVAEKVIPEPTKKRKTKTSSTEKPKKPRKVAQKKIKTTKMPPISQNLITFAHKKPPKTFKKWKFIED